jgi:hypothetical protein
MAIKSVEKLKIKKRTGCEGNGGARKGAGRKPKLLQNYKVRELFNSVVDNCWDDIVVAMRHHIKKKDKDFIKFIVDQRIGKAAQALDVTSGGEKIPLIMPSEIINKNDLASGTKSDSKRPSQISGS